ncbi:MAG TPA: metallopeptidase TldD-related protein, partial [Polyangiaceae bacterium]
MHTRRDVLNLGLALGAVSVAHTLACGTHDSAAAVPLVPQNNASAKGQAKIVYFARFGVDENMIKATLAAALARGGDYADVFFQHKVSSVMALEDGEVNRAYMSTDLGVGVRVVKGDQTGYGYTEELTVDALKRAAQTAAAIADGPSKDAPMTFHVEPKVPTRYSLKRAWEDVKPEEKLPILTRMNARALEADARIKKVSTGISSEYGAVLVADSDGRLIEDVQPMTSLWLSCTAEKDGRRETNGYNVAGRNGFDFYSDDRLDRVVKEAVSRTTILFEAVQAPAGEMPIVMAAGSSGILLHEAIGHGMEADFNRKSTSIYSDKIGRPIAKPFVNIVDDGSL